LLTDCPLPDARVGEPYSAEFSATGGAPPYRWSFVGSLPAGLQGDPGGRLAGTPNGAGTANFSVNLQDAAGQTVGRACSLNALLPPFPDIRIVNMPATVAPATSLATVAVELSRPYALPITGRATLAPEPDTGSVEAAVNRADPRVRLQNGQMSTRFTIAPGARQATIPIASSGTVAGNLTLVVSELRAQEAAVPVVPVPRSATIARLAPVITDACFAPTSTGLEVQITGYSTTRQLTRLGIKLPSGTLTADVSLIGTDYFAGDASVRFGGAFTLRFPVTSATAVTSSTQVSVTLANAVGTSAERNAPRCP
jgi:hypothetical protein